MKRAILLAMLVPHLAWGSAQKARAWLSPIQRDTPREEMLTRVWRATQELTESEEELEWRNKVLLERIDVLEREFRELKKRK